MAEYINRKLVLQKIAELQKTEPHVIGELKFANGFFCGLDEATTIVQGTPVANVVTQLPGFWKSYDTSAYIGMDDFGEPRYARRRFYRCNRCGTGSAIESNYCPYCGSKMVGYE